MVDVYHQYAACSPFVDVWSRLHIHGLNVSYLSTHGFKDEVTLIDDFKRWLRRFHVLALYGNDPTREISKLDLNIIDIGLPP